MWGEKTRTSIFYCFDVNPLVRGEPGSAADAGAARRVNINASDALLNIHADALCLQQSLLPARTQPSA